MPLLLLQTISKTFAWRRGFAAHLAADDRISLIQFDDRVVLLQDWTKSLVQLRRALKTDCAGNVYPISRCDVAGVARSGAAREMRVTPLSS